MEYFAPQYPLNFLDCNKTPNYHELKIRIQITVANYLVLLRRYHISSIAHESLNHAKISNALINNDSEISSIVYVSSSLTRLQINIRNFLFHDVLISVTWNFQNPSSPITQVNRSGVYRPDGIGDNITLNRNSSDTDSRDWMCKKIWTLCGNKYLAVITRNFIDYRSIYQSYIRKDICLKNVT